LTKVVASGPKKNQEWEREEGNLCVSLFRLLEIYRYKMQGPAETAVSTRKDKGKGI